MDRRHFLRLERASRLAALPPSEPPPTAGGLDPFVPSADAPWDRRRAAHLVRRTGFGYDTRAVDAALGRTPAEAAESILRAAVAAGTPPRPSWADLLRPPNSAPQGERDAYNRANREGIQEASRRTIWEALGLRHRGSPLRERMALLWHNMIPISRRETGNRAHRLWEYNNVLRRHALGDYRDLVREIGLTQAMLDYLDGNRSRRGNPNENYAREVLELFTMGISGPDGSQNYTQEDITELSRAFTGWQTPQSSLTAVFNPNRFDNEAKTVFGVTGNFDYDGAITLIFEQRRAAIAHYVARRIYREFVHDTPNEEVVAQLATVLDDADFQIEAAVRTLLASSHFHSEGVIGSRVASPFEHAVGLLGALQTPDPAGEAAYLLRRTREAGQEPFDPPDVSGWDVGRLWLDTSTLPARWTSSDELVSRFEVDVDFVMTFPNPYDPYEVIDEMAARLLAVPLTYDASQEALEILLGGIPDYEWNPTADTAPGRIRATMRHLARLPEFQLT
ncbi:MAG: DUF1800 domain-containing protein [Bacteroidota bacterium]